MPLTLDYNQKQIFSNAIYQIKKDNNTEGICEGEGRRIIEKFMNDGQKVIRISKYFPG